MSEKRFRLNEEDRLCILYDNRVLASVGFSEIEAEKIVNKLNEQQELIEELRLQEKEKGVPVFVVRDGKNPVALFFNEQRAMYYCQENMAHLTYQQEKWCRVE